MAAGGSGFIYYKNEIFYLQLILSANRGVTSCPSFLFECQSHVASVLLQRRIKEEEVIVSCDFLLRPTEN
ncbi:MAG: hypothetical protein ACI86M_000042 [Saprospiraceae bacterium]|jgi:hypothetical protein